MIQDLHNGDNIINISFFFGGGGVSLVASSPPSFIMKRVEAKEASHIGGDAWNVSLCLWCSYFCFRLGGVGLFCSICFWFCSGVSQGLTHHRLLTTSGSAVRATKTHPLLVAPPLLSLTQLLQLQQALPTPGTFPSLQLLTAASLLIMQAALLLQRLWRFLLLSQNEVSMLLLQEPRRIFLV